MTQLYETMVLLDNDVVRSDWKKAKAIVTDTVAKYDGALETCRRWDERRLAYAMNNKHRATFYLAYHAMSGDNIPGFLRDLELNERVLRYMMLRVEECPEEERKLAAEEDGSEYTVPEPPDDDLIEVEEEEVIDPHEDVPTDVPAEASATAPEPPREG